MSKIFECFVAELQDKIYYRTHKYVLLDCFILYRNAKFYKCSMDLLNLFIKEIVAIIYLLYMGNRKMSPVSYTTLDIVIID